MYKIQYIVITLFLVLCLLSCGKQEQLSELKTYIADLKKKQRMKKQK